MNIKPYLYIVITNLTMRKSLLGLAAGLVLLSSCSEDIDLTANYKDITIVYGLINPESGPGVLADTVWVRIEKAFLGDGNALLYAENADSIYYGPGLQAYVLAYNSSGVKVPADSFLLTRLVDPAGINKDTGMFAHTNTVLYQGVKAINTTYSYEVVIVKPNGDTTRSRTPITRKVTMNTAPSSFDWEPDNILVQEQTVTIRWVEDLNTYAYQPGIKFKYEEWDISNPGNVTNKSFTYYFPMFKLGIDYTCNTNQVCYEIKKSQFYTMIVNNIAQDPNKARRFTNLDIIVLQASEELYNYITINAPSLSYVQKVDAYTNIENGLGIWGSRCSGGYTNMQLNNQTKDSLRLGRFTNQLNFQP